MTKELVPSLRLRVEPFDARDRLEPGFSFNSLPPPSPSVGEFTSCPFPNEAEPIKFENSDMSISLKINNCKLHR